MKIINIEKNNNSKNKRKEYLIPNVFVLAKTKKHAEEKLPFIKSTTNRFHYISSTQALYGIGEESIVLILNSFYQRRDCEEFEQFLSIRPRVVIFNEGNFNLV